MIEALMLSAIGLLQGYILTRIDSLDARIDSVAAKLQAIEWDCRWLMNKAKERRRNDVKPNNEDDDRD